MAEKYLKTGALNPVWCDEQDAAVSAENIIDSISPLYDLFGLIDMDINLELGEGVNVCLSSKSLNRDMKTMCTIIDIESEYEAKFNFIKRHSGSPEDLRLAREIIGLE